MIPLHLSFTKIAHQARPHRRQHGIRLCRERHGIPELLDGFQPHHPGHAHVSQPATGRSGGVRARQIPFRIGCGFPMHAKREHGAHGSRYTVEDYQPGRARKACSWLFDPIPTSWIASTERKRPACMDITRSWSKQSGREPAKLTTTLAASGRLHSGATQTRCSTGLPTIWAQGSNGPEHSLSRPADVIGLGLTNVWLGEDYDRDVSTGREHSIETFYKLPVRTWLSFTPDFQWIVNPSGSLERPTRP